ncbi:hypothetical protein E4U50_005712 [Claviceps purpurea]|nr:hypothetical protein E4U50_005712 [Claviceps purpurea]
MAPLLDCRAIDGEERAMGESLKGLKGVPRSKYRVYLKDDGRRRKWVRKRRDERGSMGLQCSNGDPDAWFVAEMDGL